MPISRKYLPFISVFFTLTAEAQESGHDSIVKQMMEQQSVTGSLKQGTELILEKKFEQAGSFFTREIEKNEGNKEAYFNRGVVNWEMNNPEHACRDWSSLLALGDTAAFKLLDNNCHGNMIIEEDTVPETMYRKMFAKNKSAETNYSSPRTLHMVDQMPQFPGGDRALLDYINKNIKFPADARKGKVQGIVYVSFIISRKGKVLYPYVDRGLDASCDKEAVRVIREMPTWIPGKLKGKPTLVRYALPVKFAIR